MGVFDEGCMGMYNAIADDELLNPLGIYKERLSQAALVARCARWPTRRPQGAPLAGQARHAIRHRSRTPRPTLPTPRSSSNARCTLRPSAWPHEFGCDLIGIQYQQGLKDMVPASDLAEGLLNNPDRPPVLSESGEPLYAGKALPHFNEVDECAGVDALITNRVWCALGSTLYHAARRPLGRTLRRRGNRRLRMGISDLRRGSRFAPGRADMPGRVSERQPPMYFRLGGGTVKGVSKPGEIVWSRVFVEGGALHCDLGRGSAVSLPEEETQRRWAETTPQWPIMNALLHGVTRDQFMGRHHANHINVAYAPSAPEADRALAAKAAMFDELGVAVHLCGKVELGGR